MVRDNVREGTEGVYKRGSEKEVGGYWALYVWFWRLNEMIKECVLCMCIVRKEGRWE